MLLSIDAANTHTSLNQSYYDIVVDIPLCVTFILNYAWNNTYPKNRSALTYWEEDYLSRLDLGKKNMVDHSQ